MKGNSLTVIKIIGVICLEKYLFTCAVTEVTVAAKLKQAIALEIPKNKLEKDEIAAPHCLLAQVKEAQGDKKAALVDWNTCNRFANPTIPEQDGWRIVAQKRIAQSLNQK